MTSSTSSSRSKQTNKQSAAAAVAEKRNSVQKDGLYNMTSNSVFEIHQSRTRKGAVPFSFSRKKNMKKYVDRILFLSLF